MIVFSARYLRRPERGATNWPAAPEPCPLQEQACRTAAAHSDTRSHPCHASFRMCACSSSCRISPADRRSSPHVRALRGTCFAGGSPAASQGCRELLMQVKSGRDAARANRRRAFGAASLAAALAAAMATTGTAHAQRLVVVSSGEALPYQQALAGIQKIGGITVETQLLGPEVPERGAGRIRAARPRHRGGRPRHARERARRPRGARRHRW